MTTAIIGLVASVLSAGVGVWKLVSDNSAAENTAPMQTAAEAQQQTDFAAKATQAHAQGDLNEIRDLESE
jgi:hypothetical protein